MTVTTEVPSILQQLWDQHQFTPNEAQREAILHTDGPLYLPAGPGSGKTRVLLWRAVYLIACRGVKPEEIFLSTFTEKAARQLREGLRALLGAASNLTEQPYDLGRMYVGTVHSLCQRILADRRFYLNQQRARSPVILDELGQYFYLYRERNWRPLREEVGLGNDDINACFGTHSQSRHEAVSHCISLFNRLSEEVIDPSTVNTRTNDETLKRLLKMYGSYVAALRGGRAPLTDLSLLQQEALRVLDQCPFPTRFRHVIVDEYQDTNTVQEQIFFRLAEPHGNLCVVGDDDQALYRFRGAAVENFVQFPDRCRELLGTSPREIPLAVNYRSRAGNVRFYTDFIEQCDWRDLRRPGAHFRVVNKNVRPNSTDGRVSVVASTPAEPEAVCREIAELVARLIIDEKVQDPNQIAFLFPSLKSPYVARMQAALEEWGIRVYAPRAGCFLNVEESRDLFGVLLHVLGRPERRSYAGSGYKSFHDWVEACHVRGADLIAADPALRRYVEDRQAEIDTARRDYDILARAIQARRLDRAAPCDPDWLDPRRPGSLASLPGLSQRAARSLGSPYLREAVEARARQDRPLSLRSLVNRAVALDWSVLDAFYRICGFDHFKAMFDLAECGKDEGPICNLSLLSQTLARFVDEYAGVATGEMLAESWYEKVFFGLYLYALYRRSESEYENAEDPFPKGRVPFLTIHQAKGLEFPVVVLANPRKDDRGPQPVEELVHPLLEREGEPLDRMAGFDIMRLFYVALSRPQNLLIVAHYRGKGQHIHDGMRRLLENGITRIPDLDVGTVPAAKAEASETPRSYSFTADYLMYTRCPRQYMLFRKYAFAPSRSQTMMFGSLVHQTLDDLHNLLIAQRRA